MTELPDKFDLTGKTAFVTGAGTGLGYHMARCLVSRGARVMIAARRRAVLEQAARKMNEEAGGETVLTCPVDLSNPSEIEEQANWATNELNGVDIFVGNAAQDRFEPFDDTQDSGISELFQINVIANMSLARRFLPHMRRNRWGRIIFSSSIAANRPSGDEHMVVYASTKGALSSFARALANEVGRDGINVNSLILGVWKTEMYVDNLAKLPPETAAAINTALESMTSLGRLGEAHELEGLIQLLASNAGSYITGTESVIDGGLTGMMRPMMGRD